ERDIVVLDRTDRPRVEHRAVLDGIDAAFRGDAHAHGAVRVCGDTDAELVRLSHRGARLVERELRHVRTRAGAPAEHTAGGEELDHAGPGQDLLTDAPTDLVRAVADPADLHAVPTGHGDAAACRDDARAIDDPGVRRASELDDHRPVRAKIADR